MLLCNACSNGAYKLYLILAEVNHSLPVNKHDMRLCWLSYFCNENESQELVTLSLFLYLVQARILSFASRQVLRPLGNFVLVLYARNAVYKQQFPLSTSTSHNIIHFFIFSVKIKLGHCKTFRYLPSTYSKLCTTVIVSVCGYFIPPVHTLLCFCTCLVQKGLSPLL